MERVVQDELLDSMPFDHPECLRSRREIQWLNSLMGSHRWLRRMLWARARAGDRILELGAGHGDFAQRVNGSWGSGRGIHVDGLDLCPEPPRWSARATWWTRDALAFDGYGDYQGIVSNLLLHQFDDVELASLGKRLADGPRFIIACEPARRSLHLAQLKFLALFGRLGRVTRHDGAISIQAGFLGDELPRLLGLDARHWRWNCSIGWRGRYCMIAERIGL